MTWTGSRRRVGCSGRHARRIVPGLVLHSSRVSEVMRRRGRCIDSCRHPGWPSRCVLRQRVCEHRPHRLDDPDIPRAPAEIPRQLLAHAGFVRAGKTPDDVIRGDQHPRRAVSALKRVVAGERLAQGLHQRVVVEAFDGAYIGAVAGDGIRDAASDGCSVNQHRAGAAHTVLAAEMGAGEAERVAE